MLKKLILSQANKMVAINKNLLGNMASLGVPENKVIFIPNGVDTSKYAPATDKAALRKKLGLPLDKTTLVFSGRLVRQKDIPTLITAYALLEKKFNNVFLLMIGGANRDTSLGDGKKVAEAFAKKAWATSIEDAYKKAAEAGIKNIMFTGFVENVSQYLAASDIYILPSLTEGMSNSLLEGMSTGLAVVVSDIPANTAVVKNGETGLVFEAKNTQDLCEKVSTLLTDKRLVKRLGTNARKEIIKNYSIDLMLNRYLNLIVGK